MDRRLISMRCIAIAASVGLGFWILAPLPARGYAFLGGALRLDQRDVRVFDNFSDPEARDSLVEDPNFPGANGATLAIWKAAVEWGSEAHGDGLGDPSQGVLGSGGANFDFSWQGHASSVGGPNDNIVSEIAGSSFGVYAFTETPIEDGWRIRFYSDAAVWEDDPRDSSDPSFKDIQGVATHELGHALGLAHSADITATMVSFLVHNGIPFRSIEADDIAGIQALYGPRAPDKPHVGTYELGAGVVTVRGHGFSAGANEVWFTRRSALADGTPLKVTGLPSFDGGTRIEVPLPDEASQGDVLVHKQGGGGSSLSNAFPFDPGRAPCPTPRLYGTAKTTSQGTVPALYLQGRPSVSAGDFRIATDGGVPDQFGVLVSSGAPAALPFRGGTRWIGSPFERDQVFQFDFLGGANLTPALDAHPIGATRYYQLWFHDPGDAHGTGLSDAAAVSVCP
ncbi:MAG TPA: matrixin family metalloprotease [Planctomycetota bacterium]|nr:matrixin family metalloprotease [Planctomycetota bacterium]